ncbi:type II toxin-antitoxin system VapC family toxin [Microbacterium sp.]|uniref:type II toxin-antitoxin system VapC family toxin n=1 Tax=Microbacterium sp. TaxID=51671 RepID=UPI0039E5805E
MIVLDASVIIAIADGADPHHAAALALIGAHANERLLVHRLTMAESLVRAAAAGQSRLTAQRFAAAGVELRDELDDPLELAELRSRTGIRMPDCCVLDTAMRARATLATFDERLAVAARAQGVAVVGG